ncbi:type II secretion system secretin GspD [Ostreibacterium oceani]|nr:type II secretion system secretin GspD [Ostreibacterium oceani]
MDLIKKYRLIFCLLINGIAFSAAAEKTIQLNLQGADLREFIETVAKITGKNFVIDNQVQGQVTLISPEKFDKSALNQIFENVLAVNGYQAIDSGAGVTKIVPASQQSFIGYSGVSHVIKPNFVKASEILPSIQPLLPDGNFISADSKNNLLILSGKPEDIDRAVRVIERIDRQSATDFEIVRLQNASASDIASTVNLLLGANAGANGSRVVADERTNSILLQQTKADNLRIKALIAHLDTPIERAGNTEVIYLKNAKASDIARILGQTQSALLTDNSANINGNFNDNGARPTAPAGGDEGVIDFTNLSSTQQTAINIRADDATNALIVTAPPAAMRNIKQVIGKLDIRRAQVLVEAIIAEIAFDDIENLGVQWYAAGSSGTIPVGVIDFNNAGSSILSIAASAITQQDGDDIPVDSTGRPAAISSGATFGIGNRNAGVLINALSALNNSNILSTPSLLVMDNEEAEFLVGQNIPYVTGSFSTSGNGSDNPFQTVERQDVGIKLNIKPQINEGDTIALDIYQEVSNVTSVDPQQGPTTAKRALKTTVLVEDNQVLVLGGLIDNQSTEGVQKVPGLGDVPVIGNLFRSRSQGMRKRNLMIFIRPTIFRNTQVANFATQEKYDSIRLRQIADDNTPPEFILPPIALDTDDDNSGDGSTESLMQAPAPVYERSQPLTP